MRKAKQIQKAQEEQIKLESKESKKEKVLLGSVVGSSLAASTISDAAMKTIGASAPIAKEMIEKSAPVAKELATQSMEIAKELTTGSLSLAKDIVDKGFNINWQDSMSKGWQNSVKAMDELSDSVGVIAAIKESQTVGAIQQVYQDGKSVVTGGSSTTNIQVPVSAHDEERGTNLLVHSYGS